MKIGDIESRSDGSYIYCSHKGILNLDNYQELLCEKREDESFINSQRTLRVVGKRINGKFSVKGCLKINKKVV